MAIGIVFSSSCEYIRSTNSFSANSVEYFALKPYWLACSNEFTDKQYIVFSNTLDIEGNNDMGL